jgi:hypothetical protein
MSEHPGPPSEHKFTPLDLGSVDEPEPLPLPMPMHGPGDLEPMAVPTGPPAAVGEHDLWPRVPTRPGRTERRFRGQPAESHETSEPSPSPLNVTGGQLRALALTQTLGLRYETALYDQGLDGDSVYQRNTDAKAHLSAAILAADQTATQQIISELNLAHDEAAENLIEALGDQHLTLDQVLGPLQSNTDDMYFLKSLDVPRHTELPTDKGRYIVPDLGASVEIRPDQDTVTLRVKSAELGLGLPQQVELPLGGQHLEWVDSDEVYGTPQEALHAKLEVFGALARQHERVFTHITGEVNLPQIISSESWGNITTLRGAEASSRQLSGLMTENAALWSPEVYDKALEQMAAGQEPELPDRPKSGPSVLDALYVRPDDTSPVLLFRPDAGDHREVIKNPGGYAFIGGLEFAEPSLIGVLVTPTFRRNLLHWIDTWPPEEKERIFKGRAPETILISSAEVLQSQHSAEPDNQQDI